VSHNDPRRRGAQLVVAAASALALAGSLAACGSSDDSASASSNADRAEKAQLDFAKCMRKAGVDVPDTAVGQGGGTVRFRVRRQANTPQARRAFQTCNKYLAAARPKLSQADRTKFRDAFVKFSACMRKEGVDLPDPTQGGGGPGGGGPGVRINRDDPRIQKASQKCQKLLPNGGRFGTGGPGGGGPPGGGN
jgi:hypothetical protein